ncbi:MAG TPA: MoxR family ATPase [Bacteroidales bacterium]|nr:MoxR family ATPase [Bacteroidales bacterium]
MQFKSDVEALEALAEKFKKVKSETAKVIIGQDEVVRNIIISIFSNGHALLIGVPGLAKTLMINTIAKSLGLQYSRIQFTPDLMPSDIIGSEILDEERKFRFIKGPVFANIILADEINRTPPKTQSALLEAMQEKAVTVAGKTFKLEEPFFVLATQNPIEQEGTYPLPEAQLDRFMFNIWLDYPDFDQEINIVKTTTTNYNPKVDVVLTAEEILEYQAVIRKIPVPDNVYKYAINLASITRPKTAIAHKWANDYISWGAGPRASQYLIVGAKCSAAINGKFSPDIEDVKHVAPLVLRHRIVKNYKAEAEGISVDTIVSELMK